jgi:Peptidase C13 family
MKAFIGQLLNSLARAIRFAMFRKVYDRARHVTVGECVFIMSLATALGAIGEAVFAYSDYEISAYGVSAAIATWALAAVALHLAGASRSDVGLPGLLADIAALNCLFAVLGIAAAALAWNAIPAVPSAYLFIGWGFIGFWYALLAWSLVALWRCGNHAWRGRLRFAGMRFLVAAVSPIFLVPHYPIVSGSMTNWERYDVWYYAGRLWPKSPAEKKKKVAARPPLDVEATYYRQSELVQKTLSGVAQSSGGRPQFYFVGAAPYATQNVFKREVVAVQNLFDERFGTRARSVVLINHHDTATTVPLASATNLERVLRGVGQRMDADKDILVLFITTHGSKKLLSVYFPRFSLNHISPERLARMLDQSGIKNRILIISACHAGSFIPRLTGPNTLIMTAAHAERTSFGCDNEREWTFFGDALFNHALRSTRSFPDAFEKARSLILKWEKERKMIHSDPQISVGAAIKDKLRELEVSMK